MATEARPVPRPRRTVGVVAAAAGQDNESSLELEGATTPGNKAYENVTITKGKEEKNNFSSPESSSSSSNSSSVGADDEVDHINNNHSVDVRNPYSNILMQIDQIKLSDEQKIVQERERKERESEIKKELESADNNNKPKPAPRNRTKQPTTQQSMNYENTEIRKPRTPATTTDVQNNNTPQVVISSATGAIKKQPVPTRVAPPRPPSPVFRSRTPELTTNERKFQEAMGGGDKMTRSSSTNTLDSSQDGSEASSSKFKTSSPGQVSLILLGTIDMNICN